MLKVVLAVGVLLAIDVLPAVDLLLKTTSVY